MKAIFMTEIGGRLLEVERREVEPRPDYYRAIREPIELRAIKNPDIVPVHVARREHWVAHSMPNHPDGFAVFLLHSIE
jgi:hypothetical protein